MKKVLLQFVLLFFGMQLSYSQALEIKWTQPFEYDNKLDGFFETFINTNSSYIYAKFSNLVVSTSYDRADEKIKLVAFNKNTLDKVGDTELFGYGKDLDKQGMEYYKSIILENVIYVLWTKEADNVIEIYAESFDNKLKRINTIKKIYQINSSKKATDNLVILYNKRNGNKILLGKEFAIEKNGDNLRFEYKIINEEFSLVNSGQVKLPIVITKKERRDESYTNLVCSYEFADDGNIYAQNTVKVSAEEKKTLKKGEASTYPVLMQITPENGEIKEFSVKFAKKNSFNFSSLITRDGGIKLYGFFCDLDKDVKGNDTHGTFFISMDSKSFQVRNSKFSYFTKSFLDELYAADQENQKKGGRKAKKEAKTSDEESIDDNYVIERVMEDGKDILLFCTIMNNWSQQVCNGKTCYTNYYCTKSNVTLFKINGAGEIVWAKNMDRQKTYGGWSVYDLSIIKRDGNYVVIYGSDFQMNATVKGKKTKKSSEQKTDRLEYAVFNGSTGDYTKAEYNVNNLNTKEGEEKYVEPLEIQVFDDKMYTECRTTKLKKKIYWWCLCPCVYTVLSWKGNWRTGRGTMGVISAS